jgi:hypothetical protein
VIYFGVGSTDISEECVFCSYWMNIQYIDLWCGLTLKFLSLVSFYSAGDETQGLLHDGTELQPSPLVSFLSSESPERQLPTSTVLQAGFWVIMVKKNLSLPLKCLC